MERFGRRGVWIDFVYTHPTESQQDDMAVTQSRFESVLQMRFGKPTKHKKVWRRKDFDSLSGPLGLKKRATPQLPFTHTA